MVRWWVYIKERFPLPTYAILILGMAYSSGALATGEGNWHGWGFSVIGLLLFFAVLRLMDEFKDLEKDKIAHPERPLPRGLIKREEAERGIHLLIVLMGLLSITLLIFSSMEAGSMYLISTAYLWMMYKEFYAGTWLSQRPLLYAISHQIVVVPVVAFLVSAHEPSMLVHSSTLSYSFFLLGAFFTYEVCRKLDPDSHPVLQTYLQVYGPKQTALIAVVTTSIAALAAYSLCIHMLLWPLHGALILSLGLVVFKPEHYKFVESIATVSLTAHVWAMALKRLIAVAACQ